MTQREWGRRLARDTGREREGERARGSEGREGRDTPGRCSLALVGHFRRYWHGSRTHSLNSRNKTVPRVSSFSSSSSLPFLPSFLLLSLLEFSSINRSQLLKFANYIMAVLQRCWSVFVSSVFDDGRPGGKIDARVFLRIFFEEETLRMERERKSSRARRKFG